MKVRALTFDLDDTLWDIWPVITQAEQRLQRWLAEHYPRIAESYEPEELRAICWEIAKKHPHLEHDKTALRIHALRLAAERTGYPPALAEQAFAVFYHARQEVEFFEDVLPTLYMLKERLPLGALSNGNADLELTGLSRIFNFHISAVDAGAAKPDARMFLMACEQLGLLPCEVAHVGDDPETDIWGAAQAGLKTVWVNRKNLPWQDPRAIPNATVSDLSELIPLLQQNPASG